MSEHEASDISRNCSTQNGGQTRRKSFRRTRLVGLGLTRHQVDKPTALYVQSRLNPIYFLIGIVSVSTKANPSKMAIKDLCSELHVARQKIARMRLGVCTTARQQIRAQ
jgi:hypothetical protein